MRPAALGLLVGLVLGAGWCGAVAAQGVAPEDTTGTRSGRGSWLGRPAVGTQVGYSRSNLALAGGGDLVTSRQGAITGVFIQFPIGSVLTIRPELLFSLKGGRSMFDDGGGRTDVDIELAYLEFPLLLRAAFPTGNVRPVLLAGPALALRIGCDFRLTNPMGSDRATCGRDNIVGLRAWDFGLVAGAGAEFRLRRATMALEARYTVGTRAVLDVLDLKNRAFGMTLGLSF